MCGASRVPCCAMIIDVPMRCLLRRSSSTNRYSRCAGSLTAPEKLFFEMSMSDATTSSMLGTLPRGKLRDLAELVAPRRTVGSGCSTRSVPAESITPKRLKSAIKKVAADLKANKGADNFVQGPETKGLSKLSKELLGLDTAG